MHIIHDYKANLSGRFVLLHHAMPCHPILGLSLITKGVTSLITKGVTATDPAQSCTGKAINKQRGRLLNFHNPCSLHQFLKSLRC